MENVNLEIMNAEEFYQGSIDNQRELVNVAIVAAMQGGDPVVKLPVQLYENIKCELGNLGWKTETHRESDGYVDWLLPCGIDEDSDFPAYFPPLAKKFIPAEKYYDVTLKKQKQDLRVLTAEAMQIGDSVVKLAYRAYPELRKEMDRKGWQHCYGYADTEKKNRCSTFYPKCGF